MLIVLIALIFPMEECIVKEATEVKIIFDFSVKWNFEFYFIKSLPDLTLVVSHHAWNLKSLLDHPLLPIIAIGDGRCVSAQWK